jgi:hypothetical protein
MSRDDRSPLEVLKFELSFLEQGGYGRSPHTPWRPPLIFQDSPSCPNFSEVGRPHPCDACLLTDFVPASKQCADVPCRQIPLNAAGQTIDDLYRTKTEAEVEEAVAKWLRAAIAKLEQEESPAYELATEAGSDAVR